MSAWALGMTIVFFALGLGIGILVGYLIAPGGSRAREAEQALAEQERQLGAYQESVGKHFVQTADLINQMTNSYRAVHQHLASGAKELCPEQLANHPLDLLENRQRPATDYIDGQQPSVPEDAAVRDDSAHDKDNLAHPVGGHTQAEIDLDAEGAERIKRSAGVAEQA